MHADRHANRQNYVSNYAQAVQIYVPHLTLLKSASTDVAVVGVSRNWCGHQSEHSNDGTLMWHIYAWTEQASFDVSKPFHLQKKKPSLPCAPRESSKKTHVSPSIKLRYWKAKNSWRHLHLSLWNEMQSKERRTFLFFLFSAAVTKEGRMRAARTGLPSSCTCASSFAVTRPISSAPINNRTSAATGTGAHLSTNSSTPDFTPRRCTPSCLQQSWLGIPSL